MTQRHPVTSDTAAKGQPPWQRLTDALPTPADPADQQDLLWQELDSYFRYYHRAATRHRLAYQILKVVFLLAGAAVTVLAAFGAPPAITASLAALLVVLEGAQQLFQFHANWISSRATAENLRIHAFAYAARVAPYEQASDRRDRLAAVLRDLTLTENTSWSTTMK
ncbi:MAG: DUF4231 domain-containing protein, partial [Propionibacteriaceae bacterium]